MDHLHIVLTQVMDLMVIIKLIQTQHPKMNDSAVHFYDQEVDTDKSIFNYDGSLRF